MLYVGFGLYLLNFAVGLGAQLFGLRLGIWHHVLYGFVFAGAVGAAITSWHIGMVVTLVALALFPKARPRTPWHPALAVVGLLGYLWTLLA